MRAIDSSATLDQTRCRDAGLESDGFDAMRISDKIKETLTLENVVPVGLVEYLETRVTSH